mmetsp:Transcript_99789/g.229040  ORF Transcript_99789/g.229040 Transcript_99789/m.229040 type:complete len:218 (-) Transcript_99789:145-798(-)
MDQAFAAAFSTLQLDESTVLHHPGHLTVVNTIQLHRRLCPGLVLELTRGRRLPRATSRSVPHLLRSPPAVPLVVGELATITTCALALEEIVADLQRAILPLPLLLKLPRVHLLLEEALSLLRHFGSPHSLVRAIQLQLLTVGLVRNSQARELLGSLVIFQPLRRNKVWPSYRGSRRVGQLGLLTPQRHDQIVESLGQLWGGIGTIIPKPLVEIIKRL